MDKYENLRPIAREIADDCAERGTDELRDKDFMEAIVMTYLIRIAEQQKEADAKIVETDEKYLPSYTYKAVRDSLARAIREKGNR